MEEWLSIAKISQKTRIPETSLRRYASIFESFLECEKRGRGIKYSPRAQELLVQISSLYDQGYSTVEIEEILSNKYPQTVDITEKNSSGGVVEISTILEIIKGQQSEIEQLKQDLEQTKNTIEKRDKKLMETIRKIQDEQKKPWWRRIFG